MKGDQEPYRIAPKPAEQKAGLAPASASPSKKGGEKVKHEEVAANWREYVKDTKSANNDGLPLPGEPLALRPGGGAAVAPRPPQRPMWPELGGVVNTWNGAVVSGVDGYKDDFQRLGLLWGHAIAGDPWPRYDWKLGLAVLGLTMAEIAIIIAILEKAGVQGLTQKTLGTLGLSILMSVLVGFGYRKSFGQSLFARRTNIEERQRNG